MNDELETLIMNSIDDIYKLNSAKIGEKITSLDIRGVRKKEERQRIIDIVTGLALGKKCKIKQINANGVFLIIETLTDNKNRTASEIRTILNKNGGMLAETGSASFNFDKIGEVIYSKEGISKEKFFDFSIPDLNVFNP